MNCLYNAASIRKLIFIFAVLTIGCKKWVTVEAPYTTINNENVYANDERATGVLTGLYADMSFYPYFSGPLSIGVLAGLSSDELSLFNTADPQHLAYYVNSLTSMQGLSYGSEFWAPLYNIIYRCNDAIEGVSESDAISNSVKTQLIGEAKFIRSFCFFYLINLFGDVPLTLTTDYQTNRLMSRNSMVQVYQQLIADLKDAKMLLSDSYLDGKLENSDQRVRPTKWAASALLSRAFLYNSEWVNAVAEASLLIDNASLYSLVPLNQVFLKNSMEAIWQLQPVESDKNTADGLLYNLPESGPNNSANPVYLSDELIKQAQPGDQRMMVGNWVGNVTFEGKTYWYPYKYKESAADPLITSSSGYNEYNMVLRLGEQYLIRAEAYAQLGETDNALSDINKLRMRAGLNDTTASSQELLNMILHERRFELFTEWGHRWLDIKRYNLVDGLMNVVTPIKSGGAVPWRSYQHLFPIPFDDVIRNPNLSQNPGYN